MTPVGTYRYILRDTGRLFFRHWGLSLLTLMTAASVFFLVGGSSLLALSVRKVAADMQSDLVIQAYVTSETNVRSVVSALSNSADISEIRYISPQEGLDRLRSKMGAQAKALSLVGSNPLPWTVEIKVRQASLVAPTVRVLSAMPEIDDIMYSGTLAERLVRISSLISNVALSVLVMALLVSALVFYNTVRIGIYSRRQEIAIMLLVGSTKSYVAAPFVLQGMILGTCGAAISIGVLHYGEAYVSQVVGSVVPFLQNRMQWRELLLLDEVMLCAGLALGWLSSFIAVRHYINRAVKPL